MWDCELTIGFSEAEVAVMGGSAETETDIDRYGDGNGEGDTGQRRRDGYGDRD